VCLAKLSFLVIDVLLLCFLTFFAHESLFRLCVFAKYESLFRLCFALLEYMGFPLSHESLFRLCVGGWGVYSGKKDKNFFAHESLFRLCVFCDTNLYFVCVAFARVFYALSRSLSLT